MRSKPIRPFQEGITRMAKHMNVGRSWVTPAKHGLLNSFVGQEVGSTGRMRGIDRNVWIDLTAGDAALIEGYEWRRACSPGILAYHATKSSKPVEIVLYEIQPATFDRLLANLDAHLPAIGYVRVAEGVYRFADQVTLRAINASGHQADIAFLRRTDAVLVFNDPNAITEWAMRPTLVQEIKDMGVWCFRSLSTMGCNVAGIKRIPLDSDGSGEAKRERRAWFDLIAAQQRALPIYRDLLLAGIERDSAQWAYLLCTAEKWRGSTEQVVKTELRKIGRTAAMAWCQLDAIGFEDAKRALFLTKKERGEEAA